MVREPVATGNPYLAGHFPGNPVQPGVLTIDAIRRATAAATGGGLRIGRVTSARFLAPVRPGDELEIEAEVTGPGPDGLVTVAARCRLGDGTDAASVRLTLCPDDPAPAPPRIERDPSMLEHDEVAALLPHAHPILLVDRVLELDPGVRVVAVKAVSGSERCFAGAPGSAYPDSLLIESLAQAGAVLWFATARSNGWPVPPAPAFGALRGCRVIGSARPGDLIRHEVRAQIVKPEMVVLDGRSLVGDTEILSVSSLLAVATTAAPPALIGG